MSKCVELLAAPFLVSTHWKDSKTSLQETLSGHFWTVGFADITKLEGDICMYYTFSNYSANC